MSESKSVAIEDQPSATALPTVSHFIGGQLVDGASGRYGDVYNPASGVLSRRVAFAGKAEVDRGRGRRDRRVAAVGGDAAAPARAHPDPLPRAARARPDAPGRHHHRRTRQGRVGCRRRGAARYRGGRVRHRHSAAAQGRVHRRGRHRRRQLLDAAAARRGGRHHAVQLPGDGAAVDVPGRARVRQHLHPEAEREGPVDVPSSWRAC